MNDGNSALDFDSFCRHAFSISLRAVPILLDSQISQLGNGHRAWLHCMAGQVLRETRFADNSLAQRLRAFVRFIHTGEEGGPAGQVVAAVASAGAALLVWTGLSLALDRWRAWRSQVKLNPDAPAWRTHRPGE
jgi:uncharacterized iron-regulated membrane protein